MKNKSQPESKEQIS